MTNNNNAVSERITAIRQFIQTVILMIQYLLNITIIWLLSLLCFDLFLKRETWHEYNRSYLLFTLLAGIFIPLYSRHSLAATVTTAERPLQRIDDIRSILVQTATPTAAPAVSGFSRTDI